MFKNIGPGILITAAFIGPGTITTCTIAGVNFGYALLWALLLSVLATLALQEMSARLGIVTQKGLAANVKDVLQIKWQRIAVVTVILVAILIGNTAYEGGNISGATLGLQALFGEGYDYLYPLLVGAFVFVLLWLGSYKVLESVFMILIALMSLSFLITAIITKPDLLEIVKGLTSFSMPKGSLLTVIALVGTTVVPYNLFLHAALVNEKWKSTSELPKAKKDTVISIALGGLVSMSIVIAAIAIPTQTVDSAMDLALGLEPLFGNAAKYFMGMGLFAAGITSSITAPLAAAYVANNCLGWNANMKDKRFRLVWIIVLLFGVLSLYFAISPVQIIQFAQIANGILLPMVAFLLTAMVNKATLMGNYKNTTFQKGVGYLIILFTLFLGLKSILRVLGIW